MPQSRTQSEYGSSVRAPASRSASGQTKPTLPRLALVRSITSPESRPNDTGLISPPNSDEVIEVEPPSPSICHSPTWSLSPTEKQKKVEKRQEKERKELEKKLNKERERQKASIAKMNKRLSKKPPAAMETQRMASSLARSSDNQSRASDSLARPSESLTSQSRSTSRGNSRPSSRDRASSSTSLGSIMRISSSFLSRRGSSSQPDSPTEPTATKTNGTRSDVRPGSRRAESFSSQTSTEDEAYIKDLMDFAYQVGASMDKALRVDEINTSPIAQKESSVGLKPLSSHPPVSVDTPPPSRENEAKPPVPPSRKSAAAAKQQDARPKQATSENAPLRKYWGKKDNSGSGYQYPSFSKLLSRESAKRMDDEPPPNPGKGLFPLAQMRSTSTPNIPTTSENSNYVHKQRMYQQQRSLSDYEEELAIRSVNDLTSSGHPAMQNWPLTPETSQESLEQKSKPISTTIPDSTANATAGDDYDSEFESYHHYIGHSQPRSPEKGKASHRSKASRILGQDPESPGASSTSTIVPVKQRAPESPPEPSPSLALVRSNGSGNHVKVPEKNSPTAIVKEDNSQGFAKGLANFKTKWNDRRLSKANMANTPEMPILPRSITTPIFSTFATSASPEAISPPALPSPTLTKENSPEITYSAPINQSTVHGHSNNTTSNLGIPPRMKIPEITIKTVDGDGLVRQTSIKRHRSDPEINVKATEASEGPDLDFLPELRHQPFAKPKRTSTRVTFVAPPDRPFDSSASSQFPVPASSLDLTKSSNTDLQPVPKPSFPLLAGSRRHSGGLRSPNRASFDPGSMVPASGQQGLAAAMKTKPIAKMFVICCKCKFWHDMPSKLYEAMALPRSINGHDGIAQSVGAKRGNAAPSSSNNAQGIEGKVFTTVKCPWCQHGMSTSCCAGWTTIVYLHERHH